MAHSHIEACLRAIQNKKSIKKIWMRRGTFKKGSSIPVDSIQHFDSIIHPEDICKFEMEQMEHGIEVLSCPPIVMLDHDELFSKDKARRLLEFLKMQFASMFNWVLEK